ncbi:MAG TPA: glycosyltransferase family 39 protein, partial [Candidatus Polarisedimenticolia bacterium]|nr:glycosyltransferase family 39 protein [Candidatus Polarisedimenticolia bacterium]
MRRRPGLLVFATALLVRLIYLFEIRTLPWFDVPIVDGANYARLAQTIAAGDLLGGRAAFWQPPLYSYFMAVPFAIFGAHLLPLYLLQAVLGSLTCVVTARLAARLYGEAAGIVAGLVMALYGPLVHFDLQPLIPVLHTALATTALWVALRAGLDGGKVRAWGGAGALFGLAAVATPNV